MSSLAIVAVIAVLAFGVIFALRSLSGGGASSGSAGKRPRMFKRTPNVPVHTERTGLQYLVVGGGGFLGSHIVEALLARGESRVRVLDLAPQSTTVFSDDHAVDYVQGNVTDSTIVNAACEGVDVVYHTAALVDYWSRLPFQRQAIYNVNVIGTQNVINACIKFGVKKLIQTSTTSAIFNDGSDFKNVDETVPLATNPVNHYAETKALAEKATLEANGRNGLATVSIRPNGLFGPRDNLMADAIWIKGKPDELLGSTNIHDWVYVENMVHGQLLAEARLSLDSPVAGKAFFIGNGPMPYLEFWTRLTKALGGSESDIKLLPPSLSWPLAYLSEFITRMRGSSSRNDFFKLTPPVMQIARSNSYFSNELARRLLGYEPIYNYEQAFQRVREYYLGSK